MLDFRSLQALIIDQFNSLNYGFSSVKIQKTLVI